MVNKNGRLCVAAAAIALSGGMTACGALGGGSDQVELEFWTHTHPPMTELNEELIAEFEKANPDIDVQYQKIPNTEFGTKMLTALSSGAGPDVINMDDAALRGDYIPKDLVAPLQPDAFDKESAEEVREGYVDGSLDGATGGDGKLYGVPSEFNATAFAINTAHFKDAGLNPNEPPETWDDVIRYGKQLNAAGHEQAFNFLYLHSGWYYNWFNVLLNQTGGEVVSDDGSEALLEQPKSVAALDLWVKLARTSGIADPNTASREATAPYTDLANGTQSMAIVYPWAMEQIRRSNPDTFKDLRIVPLPQIETQDPISFAYGYYWAVNAGSEHPDAAWKFVSFLSDHPDRWLSEVDFIQPVSGWSESDAAQELPAVETWRRAYSNAEFAEVRTTHLNEVKEIVMQAVNSAVFDGMAPQQAMEDADAQIERNLD